MKYIVSDWRTPTATEMAEMQASFDKNYQMIVDSDLFNAEQLELIAEELTIVNAAGMDAKNKKLGFPEASYIGVVNTAAMTPGMVAKATGMSPKQIVRECNKGGGVYYYASFWLPDIKRWYITTTAIIALRRRRLEYLKRKGLLE